MYIFEEQYYIDAIFKFVTPNITQPISFLGPITCWSITKPPQIHFSERQYICSTIQLQPRDWQPQISRGRPLHDGLLKPVLNSFRNLLREKKRSLRSSYIYIYPITIQVVVFPAPGLRGGGVDRIWPHDEKRNRSNSGCTRQGGLFVTYAMGLQRSVGCCHVVLAGSCFLMTQL